MSPETLRDALHQEESFAGVWPVLWWGLAIILLVWLWSGWNDWRHLR